MQSAGGRPPTKVGAKLITVQVETVINVDQLHHGIRSVLLLFMANGRSRVTAKQLASVLGILGFYDDLDASALSIYLVTAGLKPVISERGAAKFNCEEMIAALLI